MMFKLTILFVLWLSTAGAAELPYTFETLDLAVPDRSERFWPVDINDHGRVLTNIFENNLTQAVVTPGMNKRHEFKDKPWKFVSCSDPSDTVGVALIDNVVLGACVEPGPLTKQFGFLKPLNGGQLQLVAFPGADSTMATGRSGDGKLVGNFAGPINQNRGTRSYRFHCWTLIDGVYKQIDYPVANTAVSCSAINNRGQILMYYITATDQNQYIEQGAAIYDNGTITPLGLSFDHLGGPYIDFTDMNEDGAVVGVRNNNDGTPAKVFLWDDGVFFDIKFPEGWQVLEVGGMNNKEQFVGVYQVKVGVDLYGGFLYKIHGFLARPAKKGGK